MNVWDALVLAVLVPAALIFSAVLVVARRAVIPRQAALLPVAFHPHGTVSLPASPLTTAPGSYGLFLECGTHVRVGDLFGISADGSSVSRRVEYHKSPPTITSARWSGVAIVDPTEVGLDREVLIETSLGPARAWTTGNTSTHAGSSQWAIHIHGRGSSRAGVFRSVPASTALGMRSLVVSFRGHEGGPPTRGGVTTLGLQEWRDVEAAVEYAIDHGASSVVLFGWSMGATIALLLAERSRLADKVAALVLVDPATDWRAILRHGMRKARIPRWLERLVLAGLEAPWFSRLVGLPEPIDFDSLDWCSTTRVEVPMLIIHSLGDDDVPLRLSRQFAALHEGRVLVEFPAVPHCAEFNADPIEFTATIRRWFEARGVT